MSHFFAEPPIPFSSTTEPIPFPTDALPERIKPFVESVAKTTQVHPDMPSVVVLSVLSACAQGKAKIKITPEWSEELNLYATVIAEPGERKSAVFSTLTAPINEYVLNYNATHSDEIEAYRNKLIKLETKKSALISSNDDREKEIAEIQKKISEMLKTPKSELRLLAVDCTAEAIACVMHANREKIAILSDEGVFEIMAGLYSNGKANINIYLNAYDGQAVSIDRKSSGNISLTRPLITFGICCQPSVIEDFIADRRFIGKGLAQRFLYSQPPSLCGKRQLCNTPIPDEIRRNYYSIINNLLSLPESTDCIALTPEAFNLFNNFFDEIEKTLNSLGRYDNNRTFLSKLLGKTARICGIFHLCDNEVSTPVSAETMSNAISVSRYFKAQNELIFGISEELAIAEYVLDRIVATAKKTGEKTYRARELKRFCQKYKAKQLDEALFILQEHNYIHFSADNSLKPDRQHGTYELNPYILIAEKE